MAKRKPLKRHPALIPLSREHHKMLILAQLLRKDVPDYKGLPNTPEGKTKYTLTLFDNLIKEHFRKEEEILLPALEHQKSLIPLLFQVKDDHQNIRAMILNLQETSTTDINYLHQLGLLIEQHVRFEERTFFQKIQTTLTEEEWKKIDLT